MTLINLNCLKEKMLYMQSPSNKKKKKKCNKDISSIIEILENVKVKYNDDIEEIFEVVQVTKKGLKIGRIIDNEYLFFGFIPLKNIKKIKHEKSEYKNIS